MALNHADLMLIYLSVPAGLLLHLFTELQIRGGIEDNSKISFPISQRKHALYHNPQIPNL